MSGIANNETVTGTGGGDINVAREIAGLRELINNGDVSPLTVGRILTLVEKVLDRIWAIEQRERAEAVDASDHGQQI